MAADDLEASLTAEKIGRFGKNLWRGRKKIKQKRHTPIQANWRNLRKIAVMAIGDVSKVHDAGVEHLGNHLQIPSISTQKPPQIIPKTSNYMENLLV